MAQELWIRPSTTEPKAQNETSVTSLDTLISAISAVHPNLGIQQKPDAAPQANVIDVSIGMPPGRAPTPTPFAPLYSGVGPVRTAISSTAVPHRGLPILNSAPGKSFGQVPQSVVLTRHEYIRTLSCINDLYTRVKNLETTVGNLTSRGPVVNQSGVPVNLSASVSTSSATSSGRSTPVLDLSGLSAKDAKSKMRDMVSRSSRPVLQRTAHPTKTDLNGVVDRLTEVLPAYSRKELMKRVREYFRKQREYMNSRIDTSCHVLLQGRLNLGQPDTERRVMDQIEGDDELVDSIVTRAQLDVSNQENARIFVLQRVRHLFLRSVCSSSE